MKEKHKTKRISPLSLTLFGFFFLYLAISKQELSGDTILLFLIGIVLLIIACLSYPPIQAWLYHKCGIVLIDLEEEDEKHEK